MSISEQAVLQATNLVPHPMYLSSAIPFSTIDFGSSRSDRGLFGETPIKT